MRILGRIEAILFTHTAILLRVAGAVSIVSGMVGGVIWLQDLIDREDNDSLRWGFWHNPLMQFPPFNEEFLDISMWVLLGCAAIAGLGGIILTIPFRLGAVMVSLSARIGIIINTATAICIVTTMSIFAKNQWGEFHLGGTPTALTLRMGSILIDLTLWSFLSSSAVRTYFNQQKYIAGHAFEVIVPESKPSS